MFLENITQFLMEYQNLNYREFLSILRLSNKGNFDELKLEKDFLLTLILIKIGQKYPELIFKGGTCLNKIYLPYYRLSEDLDFTLNIDVGRNIRKSILKKYELYIQKDLDKLGLKLRKERTKFDEHKIALFTFEYISVLNNSLQTIKIDISIKNKLQLKCVSNIIKSDFIDPVLENPIFGEHCINCMDFNEIVSEKLRAALTRNTPAIRDFFDIYFIRENLNFNFDSIKDLLKIKLEESEFMYTMDGNFDLLNKQIDTDLNPVLNKGYDFDLKEIYDFILKFKI